MEKKAVMLVNDLPGVTKVALGAMIPILSYMGFSVHNLPTALVSNTLDYGDFHLLDTTEYMKEAIQVWKRLGFQMDSIATGFISSEKQIPLIEELIDNNREKNPFIMVDPIMGDHGSLYNGLSENLIPLMQNMVKKSHVTLPNLTEAYFLTGRKEAKDKVESEKELKELGEGLSDLGAQSYLITSVTTPEGRHCIYGYDHVEKRNFTVDYEYIPVNFPGTGDVFSAVLLGNLLRGKNLECSARKASDFIYRAILDNREFTKDTRDGLFIENHLKLLRGAGEAC